VSVLGLLLQLKPGVYALVLFGMSALLFGLFLYSRYKRSPEKFTGCAMSYSTMMSGFFIGVSGALVRSSDKLYTFGMLLLIVGTMIFICGLLLIFRFENG
jgi:hypothetical protein